MEVVFVASLHEEKIVVRRFFGCYWGRRLRLLGFRVGLWLLATAIVAGIGGALGTIPLLVPVLLFVVLITALVRGFTTVFVVMALIQVPVLTYFRYYALFVLGDTEETLNLILERRRCVRGFSLGGSPLSSDGPSTA